MFFRANNTKNNGEIATCMDRHSDNLKAEGQNRAHKLIQPMAPSVNAERIVDLTKVEKWIRRNCKDVLDRACTADEKADFIALLLSIR